MGFENLREMDVEECIELQWQYSDLLKKINIVVYYVEYGFSFVSLIKFEMVEVFILQIDEDNCFVNIMKDVVRCIELYYLC